MPVIHFNIPGSPHGGGPSVFVHKTAIELKKRGYIVSYNNPQNADVCMCIIESGKTLKKVNRKKTKVCVRLDGAYFKEYWHGGPGRKWRGDMTSLHNAIKRDVSNVDTMIYQSQFSKDLIDLEIAKRNKGFAIINNGVDTSSFKPMPRKKENSISLIFVAKMRNDYIMSMLIKTYQELKRRGHKNIKLKLAGSMDAECANVYKKYSSDPDIVCLGSAPNTKAANLFNQGDIFLGVRSGSSSDNTIAESLACGVPIIVPKWSGNAEFLNNPDFSENMDGKAGVIVDTGGHWNYGDDYANRYADAVEQVIPDLDNYKLRAREHACKYLTIEKMVDKYLLAMGI